MKKLKLFLTLLFIATFAMGAKISDNTLRIGDKTGSDVEIQTGAGLIKWDNGLNQIQFSNDGIGFTSFADITGNEASTSENITVDTTATANALTIDSKVADGITNPSGGSFHRVAFRDATLSDGAYNFVSQLSSLTLVIPSGATLGHFDAVNGFIYVYVLDNAGAMELAVSSEIQDESKIQTTITIDGTSDDDGFYSTVGRANVPIRLVARLISNQATAGTWAIDVIENAPGEQTFTTLNNSLNSKIEITDGASGVYGTHSAFIDATSGTPLITRQTGTWIDSLTDAGLGLVTVNFTAGTFSVAPECFCSTAQGTTANCNPSGLSSTSLIGIKTLQHNSANFVDSRIYILCIGPK